MGHRGSQTG